MRSTWSEKLGIIQWEDIIYEAEHKLAVYIFLRTSRIIGLNQSEFGKV